MDISTAKEELVKHVSLGQWEFAYIFGNIALNHSKSGNDNSLIDISKRFIYQPRCLCRSKARCNQTSWFFCTLLKNFENSLNETELRLILQDCSSFLKKSVEIHKHYCENLEISEAQNEWSKECLDDLLCGLSEKPRMVSLVIHKLLTHNGNLQKSENSVVALYLECLEILFNKIKAIQVKQATNIDYDLKAKTLCVLNLFPEKKTSSASELLKDDYYSLPLKKIFESCVKFVDSNLLSKKDVYNSLIAREKPFFLSLYEKTEDELHWRVVEWNSVERNSMFGGIEVDGQIDFNEMFLHMIKSKRHFLDGIISSSIEHILNGRVTLVLKSFSGSWFDRLLSLVVCCSLQLCNTDRESNNVLNVIKDMSLETDDTLLNNIYLLMKNNLIVTDWCISKWRDIYNCSEIVDILSKRRNIFSNLEFNSTLCVIHKYLGLRNLTAEEVFDLLLQNELKDELEYKIQIILFRGYLVLNCIMDAIYYSTQLDQISSMNFQFDHDNTELAFSKVSLLKSFLKEEGYQQTYREFVTRNLAQAKSQLDEIESVELKVELLENIFSLIFLTHNDLQSPNVSQDESDEGYIGIDIKSSNDSVPFKLNSESNESFLYSTESLRNEQCRSRSDSFQGSSQSSSGSSGGQLKLGFLCNETMLKDLINWLGATFLETKNLVYQEFGLQVVDSLTERHFLSDSPSSVSRNDILKRMSKLSVYITEAQWRYELLSNDIINGDSEGKNLKSKVVEKQVTFLLNGKHKKKKKKAAHVILTESNKSLHLGIYHTMLASPEALLRYSLIQRNLKQAGEVVKLFNLQSTYDGQEVIFSMHIKDLIARLNAIKHDTFAKQQRNLVLSIASSSLETANEIDIIDTHFLEFPNPKLREIEELSQVIELVNSNLVSFILNESEERDLAVLSDIAYSFAYPPEKVEKVLSMSLRKITSSQSNSPGLSKSKNQIVLKGILTFSKQIYEYVCDLITYVKLEGDFCSPNYCFEKLRPKPFYFSLGPLESKVIRKNIELWKTFKYQCELLSKMLQKEEQSQVILHYNEGNNADLLHSAFVRLTKFNTQDLTFFASDKKDKQNCINYLAHLYQHVKEVSSVLTKCSKDWILSKSYFSVLEESPTAILSSLLLQNSLPLKELESFATQMHLDLVHVILTRTCKPAIPNLVTVLRKLTSKKRSDDETISSLSNENPEEISKNLLNEIIKLIKEVGVKDENCQHLTLQGALSMCNHPSTTLWMEKCSVLATIDLSLLNTQEEKLAFFVNITNLLWIHAVLTDLQQTFNMSNSEETDIPSAKYTCSKLLSPNLCERIVRQCKVAYEIGQLGSVSLFMLKYWLLVKDSYIPKYLEVPPLNNIIKMLESDSELTNNFIPTIEPRALFLINEGFASSPKLQVYSSDSIRKVLNDAMTEYLSQNVTADVSSNTIFIPELLQWHYMVFANDDPNYSPQYEGLISWVANNVTGGLKSNIENLHYSDDICENEDKVLPFHIEIVPFNYKFSINLYNLKTKSSFVTSFNSGQDDLSIFNLPSHVLQYISSAGSLVFELLEIANEIRNCNDITLFKNPEYCDKEISHYPLCEQLLIGRSIQFLNGEEGHDSSWFQAYLSPRPSENYIWTLAEYCIDKQKLKLALEHLEGSNLASFSPELSLLRDSLLYHLASQHPSLQFDEPWSYALRISIPEIRTKAIVDCLHFWPAQACLDTLQSCLRSVDVSQFDKLQQTLQRKVDEMLTYEEAANFLKRKSSILTITTWQQVKSLADSDIESLVESLKTNPKLLVDCVKFHFLPDCLNMFVTECHLVCLLEENPPNIGAAQQVN